MKSLTWPMIILSSAVLFAIFTAFNIQSPVRTVLVFWFMLICPGMAFVRLIHLRDRIAEWVLALALSIAMDTIASEIAVLNHIGTPVLTGLGLALISVAGVFLQVIDLWRLERRKQELL